MSKVTGRIYAELGNRRVVAVKVTKAFPVNEVGDMAEPGDVLLLNLAALNDGWEVVTADCLATDYAPVGQGATDAAE